VEWLLAGVAGAAFARTSLYLTKYNDSLNWRLAWRCQISGGKSAELRIAIAVAIAETGTPVLRGCGRQGPNNKKNKIE
jgi:hypothetical protein